MSEIKTLVIASMNADKIMEINAIFPEIGYEVISMKAAGCEDDIVEDGDTLEDNALLKARYLHAKLKRAVFSEDTGLEIAALDGAPGVITARYAGEARNSDDNMNLVLENLVDKKDRTAQFRTVICLILNDVEYLFEGKVTGTIALHKSGNKGFGYDPIFIPDGYTDTFANLGDAVKNAISHRKRAIAKLIHFLTEQTI